MALAKAQPVLIEAMTYRGGHHRCLPLLSLPSPLLLTCCCRSTSDDSTRYRDAHELKSWNETNNVSRRRGGRWPQGYVARGGCHCRGVSNSPCDSPFAVFAATWSLRFAGDFFF